MTPIVLDALLAAVHYLIAFALLAVLFSEWCVTARSADSRGLLLLARLDLSYGVLAALMVMAGFARVALGAKGWLFYAGNPLFWAKLLCFAVIGLLSIVPTLRILQWRKRAYMPSDEDMRKVHRWMSGQLFFIPLLVMLASLMARGIGS